MENTFHGKKFYTGGHQGGDKYCRAYFDAVNKYIDAAKEESYRERERFMTPEKLAENPGYYRKKFLDMIGSPVKKYPNDIPTAEFSPFAEDDFGKYFRLSISVMEGMPFYGILQLPKEKNEKYPLIIAQHGGGGIPEFCSDMCGKNVYCNFTKRALEKGFAVFAPQLMLWNFDVSTGEKFPVAEPLFNRAEIDRELKRLGLSMTGFEVFCLRRCIDFLSSLEYIDGEKIGMMGVSYGGYFSMHTTAADMRIKAAYNAASFNDRNSSCFADWGYKGSHKLFHDAEVAALCAPRALFVDVGREDAVFDYKTAEKEASRVYKYYDAYGDKGKEKFVFNVWNGGHTFDAEKNLFSEFFDAVKKS